MAHYFLDTEFNGYGGSLLSLALIRADGESLYLTYDLPVDVALDPWVAAHVTPLLFKVPDHVCVGEVGTLANGAAEIERFLKGDPRPHIVTDWPDDVAYFCKAVITGPGLMVAIPRLVFQIERIDAYPTRLEDAVQHNAWWDAMALRDLLNPL